MLAGAVPNSQVDNTGQSLRFYARCARQAGPSGASEVVLVAINISPTVTRSLSIDGTRASTGKKERLLTASNWNQRGTDVWEWGRSKLVSLNGNVLRLAGAGEVPALLPRQTGWSAPVTIAPLSVSLIHSSPLYGLLRARRQHHGTVPIFGPKKMRQGSRPWARRQCRCSSTCTQLLPLARESTLFVRRLCDRAEAPGRIECRDVLRCTA